MNLLVYLVQSVQTVDRKAVGVRQLLQMTRTALPWSAFTNNSNGAKVARQLIDDD